MSDRLEVLKNVVNSGNSIMLKKLLSESAYTDDEVRAAIINRGHIVAKKLIDAGKVETSDDIEKLIGDDGYDD